MNCHACEEDIVFGDRSIYYGDEVVCNHCGAVSVVTELFCETDGPGTRFPRKPICLSSGAIRQRRHRAKKKLEAASAPKRRTKKSA